jgi:1-acyl-sn-glycerol-3-phosphate acyltransferase
MNFAIRLLAAGAVLAACAVLAGRLRLEEDISSLLPDSDSDVNRAAWVLGRALDRFIVDIAAPEDRFTSIEDLGRAADFVARRLVESGAALRVRASLSAEDAFAFLEILGGAAARLAGEAGLYTMGERLETEDLGESLARLERRLLEPDGAHLAARAERDPLGLSELVLAPLGSLFSGLEAVRWLDGRMVSPDGKHILILVEPGFPAADLPRSERLLAALEAASDGLASDPAFAGMRLRSLGSHRATIDNSRQIRNDVARSTTLGTVLIVALAVLTFRRVWMSLLAMVPALFGVVLALGAFALFRDSLPALVAGFGAVFLGTTVDYATHILFRADRGGSLPIRELLLGTSSTCLAFLALTASALPAVRDMGALGAVGTAAALLFALFLLPSFSVARREGRKAFLDPGKITGRWRAGRASKLAAPAALLLTVPVSLGLLRLRFEGDVQRLAGVSPRTLADEEKIREVWGDAFRLSILVVEGRTAEEALQANDALASILDGLKARGAIGGHASLSAVLPSLRTQEERLDAWRSFWSPQRREYIRRRMVGAAASTSFRPEAFEPFFRWLETDPPPLSAEAFPPGPLKDLIGERLVRRGDAFLAITPVATEGWRQIEGLQSVIRAEMPGASVLNREGLVRKLSGMVRGEMAKLGAIAFLSVLLVVILWFGRLELASVVVIPLALSCLWTLGLLGWLGIPISLANAIFIALMFAAALDYSVFLTGSRLDRFRGHDHSAETEAAVLLCATANCAGFGALCISTHPVLFSIGATAVLGIVCSLLATMVFTPALASAILRFQGPNGTASIRSILMAAWVYQLILRKGLWYTLVTRPRLRDPARRRRAALDVARRTAVEIRRRAPLGRRIYLRDEPARFASPAVIVANHESIYDIMALLALPVLQQILVKRWVWKAPLLGRIARDAGYFLAEEMGPQEILERARESVREGISILVFPEGTRTSDGTMGRFHNGAFALARGLGIPVVPVAMVNTRSVVRRGAWWVGDHDVRIAVLDPLDPRDFQGKLADHDMACEARRRILEARDRLWLETVDGPRWYRILGGLYRYLGTVAGFYAVSKARRDPLVRALPRLCPGNGEVLVAGCGMGIMTSRLALAFPGRRLRAVDTDGRKVEMACAALGPSSSVAFVTGDIREADLGSPETALLADVLHYWPDDIQRAILRRLAEVLPPGGRLVFRDGSRSPGWRHVLIAAGEKLACAIGFTRQGGKLIFKTREGWCTLLEECGFIVDERLPDLCLLSNEVLLCRKGIDPSREFGVRLTAPAEESRWSPGDPERAAWKT